MSVSSERYEHVGAITVGSILIDIHRTSDGTVIVLPRPTDWADFASFAPNICLSRSKNISEAITQAVSRISPLGFDFNKLAIMGASQGGFIAIQLGVTLLKDRPGLAQHLSITTFNAAPLVGGAQQAEIFVGACTTNYRTALADSETNLLGYKLGDYVTMLGALPGATYEVDIRPVGEGLSPTRLSGLPYAHLHADLYLLPDHEDRWQTRCITKIALNNSGLSVASAMAVSRDDYGVEKLSDILHLVAAGLIDDSKKVTHANLDPCLAVQLQNLAAFAKRRPRSTRWRTIGRITASVLAQSNRPWTSAASRMAERVTGHVFHGVARILGTAGY